MFFHGGNLVKMKHGGNLTTKDTKVFTKSTKTWL